MTALKPDSGKGGIREADSLQACGSLAKGTGVLAGPRRTNSVTTSRARTRTWEYATWRGQRDFADVVKVRDTEMGKLSDGPNVITSILITVRQEGQSQRMSDNRSKSQRDKRPQAKEFGQPLEAGEGKEMGSPLEPSEGRQPCYYIEFSPATLVLDF